MVDFAGALAKDKAARARPCARCGADADGECVALGGDLDGWPMRFDAGVAVRLMHAERYGKKLKPPASVEAAHILAAQMADVLVLEVGERRVVDKAALEKAEGVLVAALNGDRRACVEWYRSNVRLLMQTMGVAADKCSSCGAPIWWVTTKNGKPAPISVDGLSHFADCRTADQHRRKP